MIKLVNARKQFRPQEIREKLEKAENFESFLKGVGEFYSTVNEQVTDLLGLEKALYEFYFLQIAKFINAAPAEWQDAFSIYLSRFEVENLKRIIQGLVAQLPREEIEKRMFTNVERLLEHDKLFHLLLDQANLEDFTFVLKNSPYARPIREGLEHYKNAGELFQIQMYLDRHYYSLLAGSDFNLSAYCKDIWNYFISGEVEIYNILVVYRGLFNGLDREFIKALVIPKGLFLHSRDLLELVNLEDFDNFKSTLLNLLQGKKVPPDELARYSKSKGHPLDTLPEVYMRAFRKFYISQGDLKAITFARLLEIMKLKLQMIETVLGAGVKIAHKIPS
ncbi:MAG: V-type ATPase subunit [Promethearchaeota archaeon]